MELPGSIVAAIELSGEQHCAQSRFARKLLTPESYSTSLP